MNFKVENYTYQRINFCIDKVNLMVYSKIRKENKESLSSKRIQAAETKSLGALVFEQEKFVKLESKLKESEVKTQRLEEERNQLKHQLDDL